MTIWKFDVLPEAFSHEMPRGAKVLSVAVQPSTSMADIGPRCWGSVDAPRMWVLVDPAESPADDETP